MDLGDGLFVHSFGEAVNESVAGSASFELALCPVGVVSVRRHQSLADPDALCWYKCEVLLPSPTPAPALSTTSTAAASASASASASAAPQRAVFQVTCEHAPAHALRAASPDAVWALVADAIFQLRSVL
jgi:hypothetical protein